jgi:hypothetical protein
LAAVEGPGHLFEPTERPLELHHSRFGPVDLNFEARVLLVQARGQLPIPVAENEHGRRGEADDQRFDRAEFRFACHVLRPVARPVPRLDRRQPRLPPAEVTGSCTACLSFGSFVALRPCWSASGELCRLRLREGTIRESPRT